MPVICPTGQVAMSNAGGRRLLCMGLFSIFRERAPRRELSNVTRSQVGKGTVLQARAGKAKIYEMSAIYFLGR
jgi:hypothetical protein